MGAQHLATPRAHEVSICRCPSLGGWMVLSVSPHQDSSGLHGRFKSRAIASCVADAIAALPGYRRAETEDERTA
jgi:hypothetical protein